MRTAFLYQYLVHRARIKREQLNYSPREIENYFLAGIRNIAGVELNDEGFPLYDNAPPEYNGGTGNHFLNNFIYWELIHTGPID